MDNAKDKIKTEEYRTSKKKIKNIETDVNKFYEIYPRKKVVKGEIKISLNQKTIGSYVEAMKAKARFPPIEVQRVLMDGGEKIIPLDGVHRLKAIEQYNKEVSKKEGMKEEVDEEQQESYEEIEEVEVTFWKDEVLDYEKNKTSLLMRATLLNVRHGDRLSMESKEILAKRLTDIYLVNYEEQKDSDEKEQQSGSELERIIDGKLSNDEFQQELAKYLSVSRTTIYYWVGDKFKSLTNKRDLLIYKLHMLGWSGPEIARQVENSGLEQSYTGRAVNLRLEEEFSKLKKLLTAQFESKKPVPDVVKENEKYYGLDNTLAWAIVLQGKTDIERFEALGLQPKVYDVWNFAECNKLMGQEHPGRIPGQILLNALYYNTEQGDLVVDLTAGGGTTNDACLLMGRKCYSYDINPPENRKDIIQHDFLEGLPDKAKKADLIFLDPPYFKKKESEYGSESISALNREDYLKAIDKLAEVCEGHKVTLIMGKYYDYENPKDGIFLMDYGKIFEKHGFRQVDEISSNLPPPEGGQHAVILAKEKHRKEILKRDLIIFSECDKEGNKKE